MCHNLHCFVTTILLLLSVSAYAQDHGHDHDHAHGVKEKIEDVLLGPSKKNLIFKGYGNYRQGIREICRGLLDDSRIETFVSVLKSHSERDPLCGACRPLYRQFISECASIISRSKPKKSLVKKKVEVDAEGEEVAPTPTPTVPVPSREPNPVLVDRISSVFNAVAEDEAINHATVGALAKLAFLLQDKNIVASTSAREYFSNFMTYLQAPFDGIESHNLTQDEIDGASKLEEEEGAVDVLFEE